MGEIVAIISPGKERTIKAIIDALYEENIDFTIDDNGISFENCLIQVVDRTKEEPLTYGGIPIPSFSCELERRNSLNDFIDILPVPEDVVYTPEVPRMNKQLIKQYNHRTNDLLRRYGGK